MNAATRFLRKSRFLLCLLFWGLVFVIGVARAEGNGVALLLEAESSCACQSGQVVQVAPLQVFDLEVRVPAPSDSFNAYEVTLVFDPAHLLFQQLAPLSLQEGALMTTACPSRFHVFSETSGTIELTHSLLCAGVRVAGEGTVYRLRFQAADHASISTVEFTSARVVDAGIPLGPITTTGVEVRVGDVSAAPSPPPGPLLEGPMPNPTRGAAGFSVRFPRPTRVVFGIYDSRGRRVSLVYEGAVDSGSRTFRWNGRDRLGRDVPPGVYYARLDTQDGTLSRRLVRLSR